MQTMLSPLGTAMWVGRGLQGHAKPKSVSAFVANLEPNTAWADAWIAALKVVRTALQHSCSLAAPHLTFLETIGTIRINPADSTMDMSSSFH